MGVAALIIAIIGILFGILPLVYTQLVGIVIGVIAVVLGVWGRKQAADQGQPTGTATTATALGTIAVLLSGVLYGTFIYSAGKLGDELVNKIGSEFKRTEDRGGAEFRRAVERAIQRARVESSKPLSPPSPPPSKPPAKAPPKPPAKAPPKPPAKAPPKPPAKTPPKAPAKKPAPK